MISPPPETLTPKSTDQWTLVTRRRRRHRQRHPPPPQTLTLTPEPQSPYPFSPSGSSDPFKESKLLRQIQSAILQLQTSKFLPRFLSRLRHPHIQQSLHKLLRSDPSPSPSPQIQIVAYGIGSIESRKIPRLQLAVALLLNQELCAKSLQVFDPILSAVECAVLASLGCRVIPVNESARRVVAGPTIFYMPHCEAALYDNLLSANWDPAMLRWMAVLGNSFGVYRRYVSEMRGDFVAAGLEASWRHLLGVGRFVREVEMEEREKVKEDGDEVEFYHGFHDMSWHFFEIDDDADLGFVGE